MKGLSNALHHKTIELVKHTKTTDSLTYKRVVRLQELYEEYQRHLAAIRAIVPSYNELQKDIRIDIRKKQLK